MHQKMKAKCLNRVSQWGVVMVSLLTQEFLYSEGEAAMPLPILTPHPPKQIKCLIQTRPLSAPQSQPLSRPQGTMPTVIRRQHRWSNTDTQVQLLHSDCWWTLTECFQLWDRMCWTVDRDNLGFMEHTNLNTHFQCRRQVESDRIEKQKDFSWLCLITSERWTHKKSA